MSQESVIFITMALMGSTITFFVGAFTMEKNLRTIVFAFSMYLLGLAIGYTSKVL